MPGCKLVIVHAVSSVPHVESKLRPAESRLRRREGAVQLTGASQVPPEQAVQLNEENGALLFGCMTHAVPEVVEIDVVEMI